MWGPWRRPTEIGRWGDMFESMRREPSVREWEKGAAARESVHAGHVRGPEPSSLQVHGARRRPRTGSWRKIAKRLIGYARWKRATTNFSAPRSRGRRARQPGRGHRAAGMHASAQTQGRVADLHGHRHAAQRVPGLHRRGAARHPVDHQRANARWGRERRIVDLEEQAPRRAGRVRAAL